MLRNRAPLSRATPTTLCQKCLKRGHYSYECTLTVQDRPYASRASRTQQLANPKLKPKLSTDVPEEFIKKKESIRDRPSRAAQRRSASPVRKRPRSASFSSVSTVSTSRSTSGSSSPHRSRRFDRTDGNVDVDMDRFGEPPSVRRGAKQGANLSDIPISDRPADLPTRRYGREDHDDRQTRRRLSSISPASRGRTRYSGQERMDDSDNSCDYRASSRERRRRQGSMDHSRIARARTSHTPEARDRNTIDYAHGRDARIHSTRHNQSENPHQVLKRQQNTETAQRERSLSPYSRRLLLTQAMNSDANR